MALPTSRQLCEGSGWNVVGSMQESPFTFVQLAAWEAGSSVKMTLSGQRSNSTRFLSEPHR